MSSTARRNNLIIHLAFWVGYCSILTFIAYDVTGLWSGILRAVTLVTIHAGVFYLNSEVLMPRFLIKKKYWLYFLLTLVTILIVGAIIHVLDRYAFLSDHFSERGGRFMKKAMREMGVGRGKRMLLHFIFGVMRNVFWTVLVLFISMAYTTARNNRKREQLENELRSEKLEAEMKFLKSQTNPHFLFNALNNIYALSQMKSDRTPEMVLKLSDILRYNLYECNDDMVPLEKEIAYIENYIGLQQLKSEHQQNIVFTNEVQGSHLMIAPMLLIPFIENSFKHSKIEDTEKGWVTILIEARDGQITFKAENSVPDVEYTKDKVGGIGLQNVQRRLELIYPEQHKLDIEQHNNRYSVTLQLQLL